MYLKNLLDFFERFPEHSATQYCPAFVHELEKRLNRKNLIIFLNTWTENAVDGLPNAELKVKLITGKP